MTKYALSDKATEVISAASISKLLVNLIFSLGIGLSGLVNSPSAEAGGLLTTESNKASGNYMTHKNDTLRTVSYKLKRASAEIELPDEYNGKRAKYKHEEDGWTDGILKRENGSWYWLEKDSSDNKVLITVDKAEHINVKRATIDRLFPELVYEVTERSKFKAGDKIHYQARIYGNKGDKYKIVLKRAKDRKTIFSSYPQTIREDICSVNNHLKLPRTIESGKYHIILAIGDQEKKQTIQIEP